MLQTNQNYPVVPRQLKISNSNGFTLIELVLVIVILGILAAFAFPSFVNLGGNAKFASISSALGVIKSTGSIVHSKAITSGIEDGVITLEGTAITVAGGYPIATAILDASGLENSDFDNVQFFLGNQIILAWKGRCLIAYLDARFNGSPQYFGVINALNDSCDA